MCVALRHLSVPYIVGVVNPIGDVLQREPLDPLLSLLEHARASIGWKVELLHHHVFWNADLLPQVQALWHHKTDQWRCFNKELNWISLCIFKIAVSEQRHLFAVGYYAMWHGIRHEYSTSWHLLFGAKAMMTVTSRHLEREGKVTQTNKDLGQILMSPLIFLFLLTLNSWEALI